MTTSAVSKWERGLCLPEVSKFEDIADVLGVSIMEVMRCRISEDNQSEKEIQPVLADTIHMAVEETRKKRLKWICVTAATVILILGAAFGYMVFRPIEVDYGSSEIYTHKEINQAVTAVKLDFTKMVGCKLFSLSYAGDEKSRKELDQANEDRIPGDYFTDCIVLNSVFRSAVHSDGAWNANDVYRWSWTLVRTKNGHWIVFDKGYA